MKRFSITTFLTIVFVVCAFLIYKTVIKIEMKKMISKGVQSLPELHLLSVDSIALGNSDLKQNVPTVLIYFNSECSFCKYEAREIKQHIRKFQDANLLMVSYESINRIRSFAKQHGLLAYPQIMFAQVPLQHISSTIGSTTVPQIFIYDRNNKLLKHYTGETKMEAILKYVYHADF